MSRPPLRRHLAVFGFLFAAAVTLGCGGSTTCSETATCAASDASVDGSASPDGAGPGLDGGPSGDGPSSPSDAAPKGDVCTTKENCTNGVDDDCNGLVDCADPQCTAGYVCVPAAPPGWSGPLAFATRSGGPPAPSAPACPSSYPTDALDGNAMPSNDTAQCSCSCSAVMGAQCTATDVNYYTDEGCSLGCGSDALPVGQCVAAACSNAESASSPPNTPNSGACAASLAQTIPPVGWEETMRACSTAAVGGGCGSGEVCAARPPLPFGGSPCIASSGAVTCPAAYTQTDVVYLGVMDTRGCGPCACGDPTGITCLGTTVTFYASTNCTGASIGAVADNYGCAAELGADIGSAVASGGGTSGGSCASSGGAPTGSVTPSMPTTVCCP